MGTPLTLYNEHGNYTTLKRWGLWWYRQSGELKLLWNECLIGKTTKTAYYSMHTILRYTMTDTLLKGSGSMIPLYFSNMMTSWPGNAFRINPLAPGKFKWNFWYVIFKRILEIEGWGISCEIALIWMSLDFTDDQSTLVQVMAWCRQATSHYLNQCWPRYPTPFGVTRPQWVNGPLRGDSTHKGTET